MNTVPSFDTNSDFDTKGIRKSLGDCFEAYVGAAVLGGNEMAVDVWLLGIFESMTTLIWSLAEKKVLLEEATGVLSSHPDTIRRGKYE